MKMLLMQHVPSWSTHNSVQIPQYASVIYKRRHKPTVKVKCPQVHHVSKETALKAHNPRGEETCLEPTAHEAHSVYPRYMPSEVSSSSCGLRHHLEGDLGALEVTKATTVGGGESTTATAAATTTSTEVATATTTTATTASEATAATTTATTAVTVRLLASKVQTDGTAAAALTEVLAVELREGRLGVLNAVERNVAETLQVAAVTVDVVSLEDL